MDRAHAPSVTGALAAIPLAPAIAAALVAVWLWVNPHTPDLAAQVYRVSLFAHEGFAIWDLHWYAGHALPAYSLLFPPLATFVGMRALAALAVLVTALLGERLLVARYGEAGRWAAVWLAVAAVADLWIGRLTFAFGVAFALGSLLAYTRGRHGVSAALSLLCAAASPVAGLLLALIALTDSLSRRSWRALLVMALPACALVIALALLFPEGGWEPYPTTSFVATLLVVLGFLLVLPSGQRELRLGAVLYLGICVLCVLLHTPMGGNVERYGVLVAGPLLLCALDGRLTPAAVAVLCGIAVWTLWGPVRETAAVAGDASTSAAYYRPLERYLAGHGGGLDRVEVPFTRSHWEAAWLAPTVSLARGWEKQLDTRYDDVLLRPGLTASAYYLWLRRQAVAYVALPDVPLDPSSAREGRLIEQGLPYLREVFTGAHWRVYQVMSATPLVQGPGRLTKLGHDSFTLRAQTPGRFLVRVHYTRYWTLTRGAGCVARAPEGWTYVRARQAGALVVSARFSLGRALGALAPGARGSCAA
jgi:hypothetical protein